MVDEEYYLPISILVPAHNEAVTIVDSVASLLEQDYPLYEIVVVDDGSDDGTAQKLIEAFELQLSARPIRRVVPLSLIHISFFGGLRLSAGAGTAVPVSGG